jgi:hypothetical protein
VAKRAPRGELARLTGGHYAPFLAEHEKAVGAELSFLRRHLLAELVVKSHLDRRLTMHHHQRLTFPGRFSARAVAIAATVAVTLAGAAAVLSSSPARAVSQVPSGIERDLGTWNYDQPNSQSMTNIAVVSCPRGTASCSAVPPISLPQIGYVVFSAGPDGSVTGRTDQGCTWHFMPSPGGLELSPGNQSCLNQVVGSRYTITRWSVTFSGRHEAESITAVSHLPYGVFEFVLQNGERTRAETSPAAVRRFTGAWQYSPANPNTELNIETTVYPAPVGPVRSALTGQVTFTASHGSVISARTQDGCTWTLAVAGNTAELDPAQQTCTRNGTTTTMNFWSIASNGRQQVSIIAGIDAQGGNYLAANASLTRSWPRVQVAGGAVPAWSPSDR